MNDIKRQEKKLPLVWMAFLALFASGAKQQIFAIVLFILPIAAILAAVHFGELDFTRDGTIYALIIEIISVVFFMLLATSILLKKSK